MMIGTLNRPIRVLMIEDNPDDVFLTREALKEARMLIELYVAEDGIEGLDFLKQRGKFSDAPKPDLILLDLNLPKLSGHEVLADIKADDSLKLIPVVVLTTSQAEEDILMSYHLHANSYVSKPVDLDQFLKAINSIEEFWLTVVRLPLDER